MVVTNPNIGDHIKAYFHYLFRVHQAVSIWDKPNKKRYIGCYQCDNKEIDKIQMEVFGKVVLGVK